MNSRLLLTLRPTCNEIKILDHEGNVTRLAVKRRSRSPSTQRVILAARQYGISTVLFRNLFASRLGLNVADLECLGLLFHKRLASPTELARHTGLTSGATTAMLDRLERAGLIERQPNPDDRRGTIIRLLKSGTDKVAPWFASVRKAQDELVAGYSDDDLSLLSAFFERASEIWDQQRARLKTSSV
jgi:DNA-binding MarR family transcriptional regulator